MALVLNEEQRLLQDTAGTFSPAMRRWRRCANCATHATHSVTIRSCGSKMAEMGWASIILPEDYGGLDFGFLGLGVVLEECRPHPDRLPAVCLRRGRRFRGAARRQRASRSKRCCPAIAAGELTLALALEESHHHSPTPYRHHAR